MAWHNILSKTDRALVAYIASNGPAGKDNTYPAKRSGGKSIPCVICWSHDATEEPAYSGTFIIQAKIQVKTLALDSEDQTTDNARVDSDEIVKEVFDLFHTNIDSAGDKLGTDITTAANASAAVDQTNADLADFTAQNVRPLSIESGVEDGTNAWVDTLNLEIVASPSNVL